MHYILALRSYGDFIILINSLIHSEDPKKYTIIASLHLKPLYDSLIDSVEINDIKIFFFDLRINNGLLNLFTIKYFLSIDTIIQVKLLKKALYQVSNLEKSELIVEKEDRKWLLQLILNLNLKFIVKRNYNVYDAFSNFFKSKNYLYFSSLAKGDQVAIIPIARLKKRNFPKILVSELVKKVEVVGLNYKIYSYKNHSYINDCIYDNFTILINVIKNANLIICADSLQSHLCHLLKKNHFIFIPKDGKIDFLTPFAINYNYYDSFDKSNFNILDYQNVN